MTIVGRCVDVTTVQKRGGGGLLQGGEHGQHEQKLQRGQFRCLFRDTDRGQLTRGSDCSVPVDIGLEASVCGGCAVSTRPISRSRILVAAEQQSSYNCPQLQKMNTWIVADCELSKGQYSGTFWGIFFCAYRLCPNSACFRVCRGPVLNPAAILNLP